MHPTDPFYFARDLELLCANFTYESTHTPSVKGALAEHIVREHLSQSTIQMAQNTARRHVKLRIVERSGLQIEDSHRRTCIGIDGLISYNGQLIAYEVKASPENPFQRAYLAQKALEYIFLQEIYFVGLSYGDFQSSQNEANRLFYVPLSVIIPESELDRVAQKHTNAAENVTSTATHTQ